MHLHSGGGVGWGGGGPEAAGGETAEFWSSVGLEEA
jgi:hypothetical protein